MRINCSYNQYNNYRQTFVVALYLALFKIVALFLCIYRSSITDRELIFFNFLFIYIYIYILFFCSYIYSNMEGIY